MEYTSSADSVYKFVIRHLIPSRRDVAHPGDVAGVRVALEDGHAVRRSV
jgi:hypothetical protein